MEIHRTWKMAPNQREIWNKKWIENLIKLHQDSAELRQNSAETPEQTDVSHEN